MALKQDYDERGFVFPLRVLAGDQAKYLRAQLEEFEKSLEDGSVFQYNTNFVLPFLNDLTKETSITDKVAEILGEDLLVWGCSLFIKEAKSSSYVSWHQDLHYWGLDEDDQVTAWVALSPATQESGCMKFVPGSHKAIVQHNDTFAEDNLLSRGQEIAVDVDEKDAVAIELQPGEMSLHHGRLFHGSGPNQSDDRRIGVAIRYIKPSMKQVGGQKTLATLARGEDRFGNFEIVVPPKEAFSSEGIALRRRALEISQAILYEGAGAELEPEALEQTG